MSLGGEWSCGGGEGGWWEWVLDGVCWDGWVRRG